MEDREGGGTYIQRDVVSLTCEDAFPRDVVIESEEGRGGEESRGEGRRGRGEERREGRIEREGGKSMSLRGGESIIGGGEIVDEGWVWGSELV